MAGYIRSFEGNAEVKFDIITKEWQLRNVVPIVKEVPDAKYLI